MPKSVASYHSLETSRNGEEEEDEDEDQLLYESRGSRTPTTPTARRNGSSRTSDLDLRSRLPSRLLVGEHSSLLQNADSRPSYNQSLPATAPASPRLRFSRLSRQHSHAASTKKNHSRSGSFGLRVARALGTEANAIDGESSWTHGLIAARLIDNV